jgi:hypothetical protein
MARRDSRRAAPKKTAIKQHLTTGYRALLTIRKSEMYWPGMNNPNQASFFALLSEQARMLFLRHLRCLQFPKLRFINLSLENDTRSA